MDGSTSWDNDWKTIVLVVWAIAILSTRVEDLQFMASARAGEESPDSQGLVLVTGAERARTWHYYAL